MWFIDCSYTSVHGQPDTSDKEYVSACFNILDEESFYAHYFQVNIMVAFAFLNIQRGEGFAAMWRCEKIFVHFIFITSIMRLIICCLQYISKE